MPKHGLALCETGSLREQDLHADFLAKPGTWQRENGWRRKAGGQLSHRSVFHVDYSLRAAKVNARYREKTAQANKALTDQEWEEYVPVHERLLQDQSANAMREIRPDRRRILEDGGIGLD